MRHRIAILLSNIDTTSNYLTIVALADGLTAQLSVNACEYCVDGDGNWKSLPAATNTEAINAGQTLSFKGNLTPGDNGIGTFTISTSCNLKGNCMSMLFGDNAASNKSLYGKVNAFKNLFQNCKTIKNISKEFLPATTLSNFCYSQMFSGCTSLTTAPELPAMKLIFRCYSSMFYGCKSLTQAPSTLGTTSLADSCCHSMFRGCTSLTTAPELPATTLVSDCYYAMFFGCSKLNYVKAMFTTTPATSYTSGWLSGVASSGTFVKNKKATWNVTGDTGIPSGWTVQTA